MSFLSKITSHEENQNIFILIFGVSGAGKTTFACNAPDPVIIPVEDGLGKIKVEKFPKPEKFSDVLHMVDELIHSEHKHKTLIIDSLDWLEPLLWKEVCDKHNMRNIEEFGYGKGYTIALKEWNKLVTALQILKSKMNIILIAHHKIKLFQDPTQALPYDRYEIKLNDKASGLIKESVDAILFANYETFVKKGEGLQSRGKAFGDGTRKLFTEHRPNHDGKNRLGLPYELPLDWEAFDNAIKTHSGQDTKKLTDELLLLREKLKQEHHELFDNRLKQYGKDPLKLSVLKNKILDLVNKGA